MANPRPLRLTPEWDARFTRMVLLSGAAHVVAIVILIVLAERSGVRPLPMVAYTVEITDPNALGGRLPGGAPGPDLTGGATRPREPEPAGEPAGPPAPPPEAKPEPPPVPPPPAQAAAEAPPEVKPEPPPPTPPREEPAVRLPDQAQAPEPPKPKVEQKKPEPPKPEAKKPEAAKPAPKPEPPKPAAAPPKPEAPKPAAPTAQAKKPEAAPKPAAPAAGAPAGSASAPARDAYAAAAERWRQRAGGGIGGEDSGSGPIGAGGEGPGGGGQLVGIEFLAYRQQVIDTIKAQWTNVIARPGLVAAVRFAIAPDGEVSDIRLVQSSGNPAYDGSALRAVQHVPRLRPPPARYAAEFREFQIEFHSEERGGGGSG
jgi:colicin import membrane protein